ncbi:MAG: UDP-N-acetylglucosamine--undecaprenyl-phosphate N-acetylglucosamine-phosphate transferase [Actinomycetota bacterium]
MIDLSGYLIVGASAAAATAVTTPIVGRVARKKGWMAEPDERRAHPVPTPNIGGVAFLVGLLVALAVASRMDRFDLVVANNSEILGVIAAALIITVLGLFDDIREVSAPMKVTGTVVAGLALVWFGVTMFYFRVPFLDVFVLSDDWIPLFTVVWLVGMTQAVNLIDGLDGLAAGIVAIASAAFFLYSKHLEDLTLLSQPNIGPLIAIITVGVCVGFLPFNFNPARIFMGDCGALLLGLMLAISTSVVGGRADPQIQSFSAQTYFFIAPLFIPLLILGVPIVDVLFAVLRRTISRQGLTTADRGHLHHRLIALGHGPRRAVVILWLWTALLSAVALLPALSNETPNFGPILAAAVALALFTVLHPRFSRSNP